MVLENSTNPYNLRSSKMISEKESKNKSISLTPRRKNRIRRKEKKRINHGKKIACEPIAESPIIYLSNSEKDENEDDDEKDVINDKGKKIFKTFSSTYSIENDVIDVDEVTNNYNNNKNKRINDMNINDGEEKCKTLTKEEILALKKLGINESDLRRLNPGECLNDVIINFYINHLKTEVMDRRKLKRFHFFNTFFFSQLIQIDKEINKVIISKCKKSHEQRLEQCLRWTKDANVFDKDYVFFPVFDENHWSLCILCFPAQICQPNSNSCILHLDSIKFGHQSAMVFRSIRRYLNTELNKMHNNSQPKINKILAKHIPGYRLKVPQQNNFVDCGCFLLYFIKHFISNEPVYVNAQYLNEQMYGENSFDPSEPSKLRAVIKRLILSKLKYKMDVGIRNEQTQLAGIKRRLRFSFSARASNKNMKSMNLNSKKYDKTIFSVEGNTDHDDSTSSGFILLASTQKDEKDEKDKNNEKDKEDETINDCDQFLKESREIWSIDDDDDVDDDDDDDNNIEYNSNNKDNKNDNNFINNNNFNFNIDRVGYNESDYWKIYHDYDDDGDEEVGGDDDYDDMQERSVIMKRINIKKNVLFMKSKKDEERRRKGEDNILGIASSDGMIRENKDECEKEKYGMKEEKKRKEGERGKETKRVVEIVHDKFSKAVHFNDENMQSNDDDHDDDHDDDNKNDDGCDYYEEKKENKRMIRKGQWGRMRKEELSLKNNVFVDEKKERRVMTRYGNEEIKEDSLNGIKNCECSMKEKTIFKKNMVVYERKKIHNLIKECEMKCVFEKDAAAAAAAADDDVVVVDDDTDDNNDNNDDNNDDNNENDDAVASASPSPSAAADVGNDDDVDDDVDAVVIDDDDEEEEEEEEELGDEDGKEEAKMDIKKGLNSIVKDYLINEITKDIENNFKDYINNLKNDLKNDLKSDVENRFKYYLENDYKNGPKDDSKNDYKDDLKNDSKDNSKNDYKDDLKNDYKVHMHAIKLDMLQSSSSSHIACHCYHHHHHHHYHHHCHHCHMNLKKEQDQSIQKNQVDQIHQNDKDDVDVNVGVDGNGDGGADSDGNDDSLMMLNNEGIWEDMSQVNDVFKNGNGNSNSKYS